MRTGLLGRGVRAAILLAFAVFFIAPVVWLLLAPTKSDKALITWLDRFASDGEKIAPKVNAFTTCGGSKSNCGNKASA